MFMFSEAEKKIVATVLKPDSALGPFGSIVLTIWLMGSLFLACYKAGPYLLLVYFYGFRRVHQEQLHFNYSPRVDSN